MATKNISGNLNITGNITKNSAAVATVADINSAMTPTAVGQTTTTYISAIGYNGAEFTIGTTGIGGLYIFTYGYCMILLPIYSLSSGVDYKVSAAILDSYGSYNTQVLTYRWDSSSGKLRIFQKNNTIPTGYGAYLFKVKLY